MHDTVPLSVSFIASTLPAQLFVKRDFVNPVNPFLHKSTPLCTQKLLLNHQSSDYQLVSLFHLFTAANLLDIT